MTCYLGPFALQCSSIPPMPRILRRHCETSKRPLAPSDYRSKFSTPAPAARSMPPSRMSGAIDPMPCSSGPTRSFNARRIQVVQLAAFHRLPAVYPTRDFVEVGGLMSYGTNVMDAFRQLGIYAGRILKGAKPADLPVVQSSKFDVLINAETARMLGLAVPPMLLARADEVIE